MTDIEVANAAFRKYQTISGKNYRQWTAVSILRERDDDRYFLISLTTKDATTAPMSKDEVVRLISTKRAVSKKLIDDIIEIIHDDVLEVMFGKRAG